MSAIKLTARIITAAVVAMGFAASCGQLLGDFVITQNELLPDAGPPAPMIICEAGITQCDDQVLQLCNDSGTEWSTLEVCETAALCLSNDLSTSASCLKATCSAEQMSCDDNVLRLCNPMRTGWEIFDTCESAAHCDAGNRQCLPAPCEPGDRRCNVGVLEKCNADRTAWEQLDTCTTNELCEATLAPPATVGELLTTNLLPPPPVDDHGPLKCMQPVCIPREVTCDDNRLIACNPGQTEFNLAEECATPKLCDASITYTGLRGSPRCVRAKCAVGEHRCTDSGGLEVCNADRDGFDLIEQCIGRPFCNSVAADNGAPGCEDAPCDPGDMQCNGPQIERCKADQTGFEGGNTCETRGLCNDDDPHNAFCQAPVCQRGQFSGSEFRCEGATLLRCNDQHTGYDSINSCVTPGLCNASLGFQGCQQPVCNVGESRCSGNFAQRCNAQRTGFDNVEQCAAGTCDSQSGTCADPCTVGTARCNSQGNLEECRNLLVGREVTARCGSPQLCDANARQCRTPPQGCTADGVKRCRQTGQTSVLEQCTDGRSRFSTLDTCVAGEVCDANDQRCDSCVQGSDPACEGNNLATCSANGQTKSTVACPNGCQAITNGADHCRNCVPGSVSCDGAQLVVCRQRNGTEIPDREPCATNALCQSTLASCTGENCHCGVSACNVNQRRCNGAQPEVCNDGRTGFRADGAICDRGCDGSTGRCFACAVGDVSCSNGQLFGCGLDRAGFSVPLGTQRCVSDNGGDRSQSCNGNTVVDSRCGGATSVCVVGFGCQQCDPDDFDKQCIATPNGGEARTECSGGTVRTVACTGAADCVEADCAGAGDCNTRPKTAGAICSRQGGAPGVCNGTPQQCVECLDNARCVDDKECTADSCNIAPGTCIHAPRTGSPCLNNTRVCSGDACVQCIPTDLSHCPSGSRFCNNNTCVQCTRSQDCPDADPNDCTVPSCSNNGSCETTSRSGTCTAAGGANGTCSGTTCVPNAVCDPGQTRCNGARFETCNATRSGFELTDACNPTETCVVGQGCQGPPIVCNVGQLECRGTNLFVCNDARTDFRLQQNCAPGTCEGTACVAPPPPPPPPPPKCDPNQCSFGCNDANTACDICRPEDCREDLDLTTCTEPVCAGDRCARQPRRGDCIRRSDGASGTCDADENCIVPDPVKIPPAKPTEPPDPGGGSGPGEGANTPFSSPNSLFCNGACNRMIDPIFCPSDCASP